MLYLIYAHNTHAEVCMHQATYDWLCHTNIYIMYYSISGNLIIHANSMLTITVIVECFYHELHGI